jgi:hypothetical protein
MGQNYTKGNSNVWDANNNSNNTPPSGDEQKTLDDEKMRKMRLLLDNKKFELYKILELFNFYVNMRILDKSFIMKNNIIISELEKGNITLENDMKQKDELYLKNMRNIKHDVALVNKHKHRNSILYIINIVLGITMILLLAVVIYRRPMTTLPN